jgi:hypothetical protein
MAFPVVVQEKAEFARWLAAQAEAARTDAEPLAARGGELIQTNGCGACQAGCGPGGLPWGPGPRGGETTMARKPAASELRGPQGLVGRRLSRRPHDG